MTNAEDIVALLPKAAQPYAKSLVALLVSALTIVSASTHAPLWLTIVLAVLTAPAIYATPNLPKAEDDTPASPEAPASPTATQEDAPESEATPFVTPSI